MTWLNRRRRRNTHPAATVASVDTLEQRTLLTSYLPPSGDADVFLRDGDLIVENSQGTEVFVEDGRIHAQPRSNFTQATVNGGANFSADLDEFTGDIIVDGYFFSARGFTTPGSLVVKEETGGVVSIDDMTVTGDLEVATQTQISMADTRINGSAELQASLAWFYSGLYRVSIAGDLTVSGSAKTEAFTMSDGVVHGKTLIRMHGSGDRISIDGVQFEGSVTVNTGSGADFIDTSNNEFAKRLIVNGGRHTDSIESENDSFSGLTRLRGGSGNDSFSIQSPTVWGTDDFFSRFTILGEGGSDTYEMENARFTKDRFSVGARRSVWEPQSEDEAQAISLANSLYPARGGMPVDLANLGNGQFVATYPVRAESFFQSGRPKVRVDLQNGTVNFLPPSGGRSRPVEFTDLELEDGWWNNLPS